MSPMARPSHNPGTKPGLPTIDDRPDQDREETGDVQAPYKVRQKPTKIN